MSFPLFSRIPKNQIDPKNAYIAVVIMTLVVAATEWKN